MEPPARDVTSRTGLLTVTVLAGAVAALLVLVLMFGPRASSHSFAVAVGPTPASALYALDKDAGTLMPITVRVDEGKELPAIDIQRGANGAWYYILAESFEHPVSNLYMKDGEGRIEKLTDSATAKYNLSFDMTSGMLAYQALAATNVADLMANTNWDLVMYDHTKDTETVVGKGMDPQMLPGAHAVMYRQGDELKLQALAEHATSTTIAVIPSRAPYAIDAERGELALYNPLTSKLDIFSLTNGASLNYVSSHDMPSVPTALGYVDGVLIGGYVIKRDEGLLFGFLSPLGKGFDTRTVGALTGGTPQRIYAYE